MSKRTSINRPVRLKVRVASFPNFDPWNFDRAMHVNRAEINYSAIICFTDLDRLITRFVISDLS